MTNLPNSVLGAISASVSVIAGILVGAMLIKPNIQSFPLVIITFLILGLAGLIIAHIKD